METSGRIEAGSEEYIYVRNGGNTFQVLLSGKITIAEVMEELSRLTKVHPRGQKIIYKGKVLKSEQNINDLKLVDGAKLMMMASAGLHQGSSTPVAAKTRSSLPHGSSKVSKPMAPSPVALSKEKARQEAWLRTGMVTLRDSNLQTVPAAVWTVGASVRVLDLGGNSLRSFPTSVSQLVNLQRLRLSFNSLSHSHIAWEALLSLQSLVTLALDHNQLSHIPAAIGGMKSLRSLSLGHNALSSLPVEIGQLANLEWLDVAHNRLAAIPASLGNCSMLAEVNFASNFISSIPPSVGQLKLLKVLILNNNALRAVPSEIFLGCVELATLSVNGNQITVEQLREVDGWNEFDERRRSKYNKQIEFQAMGSSSGFEEGADAQTWQHW